MTRWLLAIANNHPLEWSRSSLHCGPMSQPDFAPPCDVARPGPLTGPASAAHQRQSGSTIQGDANRSTGSGGLIGGHRRTWKPHANFVPDTLDERNRTPAPVSHERWRNMSLLATAALDSNPDHTPPLSRSAAMRQRQQSTTFVGCMQSRKQPCVICNQATGCHLLLLMRLDTQSGDMCL